MRKLSAIVCIFVSSSIFASNMVANSILERSQAQLKSLKHQNCKVKEIAIDMRISNSLDILGALSSRGYIVESALSMPDLPLYGDYFYFYSDQDLEDGLKLTITTPAKKGISSYFAHTKIRIKGFAYKEDYTLRGFKNQQDLEKKLIELANTFPNCIVK